MRITFQPVRQTQSGFALVVVLTFLVVSLVIFASVMVWVSSNANVTQRNNIFNQSESAAESATENIIAFMMRDFNNLCLNTSNSYNILNPPTNGWPIYYNFSSTNGNNSLSAFVSIGPTNWSAMPSQFTGLNGLGQYCTIACIATPQNQPINVPAIVSQTVWFGTIPVFQYAVFYNVVLEINPGAAFTIAGRVHCNTNIYCTGSSAGSPLTFLSSVDAAGKVTNNPSPLDSQNYGNRTGNVVFPVGSPIQNYDTLNLPLGGSSTNYTYAAIESMLQLPPATYALGTAAAYTTNGQNYFANRADLVITNYPPYLDTNIVVLYQNQYNNPNYLIKVAPDVMYAFSNGVYYTSNNITHVRNGTNTLWVTNYYYSYVTNATFYDYREGDTVKALQIDVNKLGAWLGSTGTNYGTTPTGGWQYELLNANGSSTDKGHVINSIYVINNTNAASILPAVRLVNGVQLPTNKCGTYNASGLGVATPMPIYVEGNYNVTTNGVNFAYTCGSTTNGCSLPACVIGDAITLLSSSFADYPTSATAPLDPTPSQSTITLNAACFEGIVPSNGSYYSGGLENFLRLLEAWGGKTVTYNGSIVVMFPSMYATNNWRSTPAYYGAPTRSWGFDTTFSQPGGLPPLCPSLKGDARATWHYY